MNDKKLPSAVEGAYVVLLGQNALLFSNPVKSLVKGDPITGVHVVIALIAVITFFNVAANWVSSLEIDHSPVAYKASHLFWDITILGILFTTTQTLIELCGKDFSISLKDSIIVTNIFYLTLCAIYIVWNVIEIKDRKHTGSEHSKSKIPVLETANVTNILNIIISIFLITIAMISIDKKVLYIAFTLWSTVWAYVMYIFVKGNTLFAPPMLSE
ncbi:MAG: hypothetical protein ABIK15_10680 [Pseudomonadota bacterium]